ncbi:MAG: nickel-dependent hydrogenase large subunit [Candidatus Pacearchaeota archaeon]|nr:nickel-dependent hydrogenase large subunit [Candidatus Pacearchaeota archaeon]
MTKEISLNHICKIEGHAHLNLKIEKNKVKKCELRTAEGARFFEALVLNKNIRDIQEIVSRICGICSCAHSVASVQALEEALGLKPTAQQKYIREILVLAERIRSHATHLYFLSLPDYYNASSVLSLGKEHKSKIDDALQIISLGNKLVEIFGGREMHPFMKMQKEMPNFNHKEMSEKLEDIKQTIIRTIKLFSELEYPDLSRDADYLCLGNEEIYSSISGKVVSHNEKFIDDDYKKHLTENIKEYATSKFVLKEDEPYMLGAMARINTNPSKLDKETKSILMSILKKMNLTLPLKNPYHNLVAQSIELLASLNRVIHLIENQPPIEKPYIIRVKQGTGVSAVEAPRGTLFHEYKIDKNGKITYCNIITPTAQNLNMMEKDITVLVNTLLEKNTSEEEIVDKIEKLIRAYDPCFSCSTHFLKVNWEKSK